MKSNLSAFLDDELDVKEQQSVLAAMVADEELRNTWGGYHLIRDALHRTPGLDHDFTARVMTNLDDEDVLVAPWQVRPRVLMRSLFAVAATVAGVAVVAWVAIAPSDRSTVALSQAAHPTIAAGNPASNRMQEYWVAHQAYSPVNNIQGGASYVRSVSVNRVIPKQ
jgi:sigma-E factor negative regulatory protein RseA